MTDPRIIKQADEIRRLKEQADRQAETITRLNTKLLGQHRLIRALERLQAPQAPEKQARLSGGPHIKREGR